MPLYPLRPAWQAAALAALLAWMNVPPASGAGMSKSSLVAFDGFNGATAYAGVLRGTDGNYYGTTLYGGVGFVGPNTGNGTIFRVTAAGAFTSLILFGNTNGANPYAPLIEGANGNLYGTTSKGGTNGMGVVYRLGTNGALTVLVSFNGTNGSTPFAGLFQGSDGALYGTTAYGGTGFNGTATSGSGTVFRVTTNSVFTNIIFFGGVNIGANPIGGLIQGQDGSLYGTTVNGGTNGGGRGTVFKVTTNSAFSSLFSFNGTNGANPFGGLLQSSSGLLYGTTSYGGISYNGSASSGNGTIFSITTNGALVTLYQFSGGIDGWNPSWAKLVQGTDGNFYGTTFRGGTNGTGTAFQITPAGYVSSLLSFVTAGDGGISPYGGLTVGPFGSFYGTTSSAGANSYGTVFQLLPTPPTLETPKLTGGLFRFSWTTLPGQKFQAQYRTNLNQTSWINLGSVLTATGPTIEFTDPPGSDVKKFYRVTLLELP